MNKVNVKTNESLPEKTKCRCLGSFRVAVFNSASAKNLKSTVFGGGGGINVIITSSYMTFTVIEKLDFVA